MSPHKHAEVIKAWADGAKIEYRLNKGDTWMSITNPEWLSYAEYRAKKEPETIYMYRHTRHSILASGHPSWWLQASKISWDRMRSESDETLLEFKTFREVT